jgi:hypothetical protein
VLILASVFQPLHLPSRRYGSLAIMARNANQGEAFMVAISSQPAVSLAVRPAALSVAGANLLL